MVSRLSRRETFLAAGGAALGGLLGTSAVELSEPDPVVSLVAEWFAIERRLNELQSEKEDVAFEDLFKRSLAIDRELARCQATTPAGALAAIAWARHTFAEHYDQGLPADVTMASLFQGIHDVLANLASQPDHIGVSR